MARNPLRILFVAPHIPTPIRLRPFQFIRHLSKKHQITVACIIQPKWSVKYVDYLSPLVEDICLVRLNRVVSALKSLAALPTPKPLSVAYFESTEIQDLIRKLVSGARYDLIHTEFIRAASYTSEMKGIPKLFDSVDSICLAYERGWRNRHSSWRNRIIAYEEWIKMRFYEPNVIRKYDRVIVSSSIDQQYLQAPNGTRVEVVTNGVDFHKLKFWDGERDDKELLFVGGMNYYVNVDSMLFFYHHILPIIRQSHPGVHLTIVGVDPHTSIRKLAKDPGITVTGYVPDLWPYLSRATVFICPLLSGSGIQNKLLEAFSVGTPVVSTSIASQALRVQNGEDLLIADNPMEFARSVSTLLSSIKLQQKLSVNGRRYVEQNHDWEIIGQQLEDIYYSIL
jgi:polysaccharide biosynthesis protein PslH